MAGVVDNLTTLYETELKSSLELKSGEIELLTILKSLGKKIAIITEGPQDAQVWTLDELGLTGYVDLLATSNHFKVSKTNGLLGTVLEHLGIPPSDMAYIGDSEERDIKPARDIGIFCIHFSERKNCNLETDRPRVNTLNKVDSHSQCQGLGAMRKYVISIHIVFHLSFQMGY